MSTFEITKSPPLGWKTLVLHQVAPPSRKHRCFSGMLLRAVRPPQETQGPGQDGAPKIAKLTYKWRKYGLWIFMVDITIDNYS